LASAGASTPVSASASISAIVTARLIKTWEDQPNTSEIWVQQDDTSEIWVPQADTTENWIEAA